jgi:hypothetical protein
MAKFDQLNTIADWTKALDVLLDQADAAAKKGQGLGDIQSDLLAFIKASPGKCDFLDEIAVAAANDLFEKEVTRLIASIASRKRDLEIATKAMSSVTEDLHKSESDLKFEKIIETLQVSAAIIEDLKHVREDLTDEEKAVLDKAVAVAKTADAIQRLVKQYKVTEKTLEDLSADAVDDAIIKKLRSILGRMIRGEQRFLDLVKATVGSDAMFESVKTLVLKHAALEGQVSV